MKISLLITLALLSGTVCAQQPSKAVRPEMDIYDGLMYAAADMQQLKKAADSLNLQYLECIAQPVYYSLPQTQALRIKLQTPTKDTTLIVARLRRHIPLAQIVGMVGGRSQFKGHHPPDETIPHRDWRLQHG